MTILDALLLGVLQGITEFLPISSSGHLILTESFMKLPLESLQGFDIAIHFGTLLAIFIYFRKDYINILHGLWTISMRFLPGNREYSLSQTTKENIKMVKYLVVSTLPAILIGVFFGDFLNGYFRNATSVAMMLILVGIFFFIAEYVAVRIKSAELNRLNSFIIGVAQACALIPGVSRSGATISAGLIQGIRRADAARFSFLLGSLAITAATALAIYKIGKGEFTLPANDLLLAGVFSSFVAGYAAIAFLMEFLKQHTLHVFALYRVILGFTILYFI